MTLTEQNIERIKKAAGKVCGYGKIALIVQDNLLIDIITENRERVHDNYAYAVKQPNNSRTGYDR